MIATLAVISIPLLVSSFIFLDTWNLGDVLRLTSTPSVNESEACCFICSII